MPFLCITNQNIPAGVLQVLDLSPNESQLNPSIDGPGQTKYVDPPVTGSLRTVQRATALDSSEALSGLTAYVVDRVQPCSEHPSSLAVLITWAAGAAMSAGDTITIGVAGNDVGVLTAANATDNNANPLLVTFDAQGSADVVAGVLDTLIGNAGNLKTALDAALVNAGLTAGAITTAVTAGNPQATILTITVTYDPADGTECNFASQVTVSFGGGIAGLEDRIDAGYNTPANAQTPEAGNLPDIGAFPDFRLTRPLESWGATPGVGSARFLAGQILDCVASGEGLSAVAMNNMATWAAGSIAAASTFFVADASSQSSGTLADVLSIVSGRGFEIPADSRLYLTSVVAGTNAQRFDNTERGSFSRQVTVSRSVQGNPAAPVNAVTREFKPIRLTVDGGSLNMSVGDGDLDQLFNSGWFKAYRGGAFQLGNGGASGVALSAAGDPIRKYAYQGARANLWRTTGKNQATPLSGTLSLELFAASPATVAQANDTFVVTVGLDGTQVAQVTHTVPAGDQGAPEVATAVAAMLNGNAPIAAVLSARAQGNRVMLEADTSGRSQALDLTIDLAQTGSGNLAFRAPTTPQGPRRQLTVPLLVAYNDDGTVKSILDSSNA